MADPRRLASDQVQNPVGLAAGTTTVSPRGLSCLGFGHIEVGTVTRLPQTGNPKPRIHRLPESRALINSMGFPNAGAEALGVASGARRMTRIGINIGKGKDTPPEQAAEDYSALLRQVHGQADYVVLNVSSPNTPGLRQLQAKAMLGDLLNAVASVRDGLTPRMPLLIKIAPDLTEAEIDGAIETAMACGMDGVIATNTTLSRDGLPDYARELKGGLSGAQLRARSTEVIRRIERRAEGHLPIIGVGGIASAADALETHAPERLWCKCTRGLCTAVPVW